MIDLVLDIPRVYAPLLGAARYKGAKGGRGSGKSHAFAELLIEQCCVSSGTRAVCIREVQQTLKDSSKRLLEDKLEAFGLMGAGGFRSYSDSISGPGGGVISFVGMQDHNAESIKSLEGYRIAWVEEAQTLSARSLSLLRPTIRTDGVGDVSGGELWFSWNPRRPTDAVDQLFTPGAMPTGAVCVTANWRDNPKFPKVLEQERLDCLRLTPDQYDHIWEGGYATILSGAYYAKDLATCKAEGRIGKVGADPLLPIKLFWDIGGTGLKADAVAIWAVQFVGTEIRVLDYYEAQSQPLATHLAWVREKGYDKGIKKATMVLPHDGRAGDKVFDVSYESALRDADFYVQVIDNQGAGAAKMRIEAAHRLFPNIWFNEETCRNGLSALGWYHEKRDEARAMGLGPDHDWSSHGADAFGLMCVAHEIPRGKSKPIVYPKSWVI